jgi:hypothetical protein
MISDAQYREWIEDPVQVRCTLFKLHYVGYSGGAKVDCPLYFANMPYTTRPTDTPPNVIFDECVREAPSFTRRISEQFTGRSTQSHGDLIIDNSNEERTIYLRLNFDNQLIEQWYGAPWWDFADFRLVLIGTIADVYDAGPTRGIGFRLSDKSALFSRPLTSTLLGGNGPEATNPMPLLFGGGAVNISPRLTDQNNLIYRISKVNPGVEQLMYWDDSSENPADVREAGVPLNGVSYMEASDASTNLVKIRSGDITSTTHNLSIGSRIAIGTGMIPPPPLVPVASGVPRTYYYVSADGFTTSYVKLAPTLADALAGTSSIDLTGPQAGEPVLFTFNWTNLPNVGSIKLIRQPQGAITCDPVGLTRSPQTPVWTAGGIANLALTSTNTDTPVTSVDIDAASLSAFITKCPQYLAAWITEQIDFDEFLDRLVISVGAYRYFTRAGKLAFDRLDLPTAGTPAYSFILDDVATRSLKLTRRILPRRQVTLVGSTNWTVQDTLAGAVTPYYRSLYASPNVQKVGKATVTTWDTDPASHIGAVTPEPIKTYIANTTDLQNEATRQATMFKQPTGVFEFETFQIVYTLELGALIYVESYRFTGYGIVVGLTERPTGKCSISFFCQLPDYYPGRDGPIITETMTE